MSRARGRPALVEGQKTTRVTTRITDADYDRAYTRAQRDRIPLSSLMRKAVTRLLDDDDEQD